MDIGKFLQPVINTGIQMKDYAHASRLYADSVFALAPKAGWMYYVVFDIEPAAITDQQWANQQRITEVGMLVKSADLPKFSVQTEVVNQYNRKTVVQKNIVYNSVGLALHDDQSNVVHNLWLNYYRYYFADSTWGGTGPIGTARDNTPGAYQNNKYLPPNDLFNPVNYGLNSKLVSAPFFRSITIYQLNRKLFTSFKLVNPIIKSWEHDRVDQSAGNKLAESKMTVDYEAVFYGVGQVKKDNPSGFAVFHYDNSPSPLSIAGGGNNSVFGPGGVVPGALELFGDVSNILNPDSSVGPLGVLGTVLKGTNLVQNAKKISRESLRAEGYAILDKTLRNVAQGGLNGLGINLSLNKGSNYLSGAGTFSGTPVAVVTAAGTGQEFGPTQTSSASYSSAVPTSANPAAASAAREATIENIQAAADRSRAGSSPEDGTPEGATASSGSYWASPNPLPDDSPYVDSNIDENSNPEDVQIALDNLNKSWANDNDYVVSQSPNPQAISDRLASAGSDEEYAAMKADADKALEATRSLQTSVDSKYAIEQARLQRILSVQQTNTNGSGNLASSGDAGSTSPSPESEVIEFDT